MEYVDGLLFTDWRRETRPSAAQLVDVLLPIVRTVAALHKSGVHHRDLNANNIVVRREDGWPFLLDFGSVRLPGARTLTQGLPPVNLSVVPPEAFELLQSQEDDARFEGGEKADLYALGVLLYGALTDGLPFNPELPPEKLVAVITLRVPRAPHWVNPKVPKSLSAITMRLLAKRPEERFESAEALCSALWEANKARTSREWKVPLDLPPSGPAPITDEEMHERKLEEARARRAAEAREQGGGEAPAEKSSPEAGNAAPDASAAAPPADDLFTRMNTVPVRRTEEIRGWERVRRPLLSAATACALVASLVALAWWFTNRQGPAPSEVPHASAQQKQARPGQEVASPMESPEANAAAASPEAAPNPESIRPSAMPPEDTTPVTTHTNVKSKQPSTALRAVRRVAGAAITCSALAGCPGAQVRPVPPPEQCPPGALETMAEWGIVPGDNHLAKFPIGAGARVITVNEGPATVYITGGDLKKLPGGTVLSGQLIFADRVYGRLTEAKVDGRTFPVCFELEDIEERARGLVREPNGSVDTVKVFSSVTVKAVRKFE